jgi:putative oxidoreductase
MSIGAVAVRIVVGGLFIGHGTQKLKGWFGGPGLEGTDQMMRALDMYPPRPNAIAVSVAETAGGALLLAGLATPLAAAALVGSMVTAVRKVHWKNGPWNSNRGWELNAVMIAAVTALVDAGPGPLSLDAALKRVRSGPGWALGTLLLGTAGSTIAIELGRRAAEAAKGERAEDSEPAESAPTESAESEPTEPPSTDSTGS